MARAGLIHKQDAGGHDDHHRVGAEFGQIDGEEIADPLGIGADPRNQVARSLGSEELQRQALQMVVGFVADIGADLFAQLGDHKCFGPAECPRQNGGAEHSAEAPANKTQIGALPILNRHQDFVDQRNREIRRNEAGRGAGQRQHDSRGE